MIKEMLREYIRTIPVKVYTDSKNLHKATNMSVLVKDSELRLDLKILKKIFWMKLKNLSVLKKKKANELSDEKGNMFKSSARNNDDR